MYICSIYENEYILILKSAAQHKCEEEVEGEKELIKERLDKWSFEQNRIRMINWRFEKCISKVFLFSFYLNLNLYFVPNTLFHFSFQFVLTLFSSSISFHFHFHFAFL